MATKSIIQIEVQDDQFKQFNERFQKYRETLSKLPAQWGAVGKGITASANAAGKFIANAENIANQFKNANGFAGKLASALKSADRIATSLGRNTLAFARNIKDATGSLLKWASLTGLFSGLLGAGGLFGISRLAQSVSGGQQSARETGSTYGQSKAAEVAYGQLLGGAGGVQSVLGKINEARQSFGMLGGKPLFGMVGMKPEDWQNKSAAEILPRYLSAVQSMWKKQSTATGGQGQAMIAQNIGMADVLDIGKLTALGQTNLSELEKFAAQTQKQVELSQSTQSAWAGFERVLSAAGDKVENVFVKAITPLHPELTGLSDAAVKAMQTILGDPHMKNWIKSLGDGLKNLSNWLVSPQFGEAVDSFYSAIDRIAGAMFDAAKFIGKWFGGGLSMSEQKRAEKFGAVSQQYSEEYKKAAIAVSGGQDYEASIAENRMKQLLQQMPGDMQRKIATASVGETFVTGDLVRVLKSLDSHLTTKVDTNKHSVLIENASGGNLITQTRGAAQ